jgi:hypothetical protein
MTNQTIQMYLRICSRFFEAIYGFVILIYLNKTLTANDLDFFQISFFIIGVLFLFFDYGRLQHIIYQNQDRVKKEYLSVRFYFFIFLVVLSLTQIETSTLLIILSIFDICAKNNLYDYRKLRHSFVYFTLNIFKLFIVIFLYIFSSTILPLLFFLLISIFITHLNTQSYSYFKRNVIAFSSSNKDYSNFILQLLVIIKSFIIYFTLSRLFEFEPSESRAILFLSNVCFTFSMIFNSSIINIIPELKIGKFYIFTFFISILLSISLFFLYTWIPELKLPYSGTFIFTLSFISSILNLIVYFYVTKLVINKKSKILLKFYLYALFFLLLTIFFIYTHSIQAIFIILFFELIIFLMILLNYKELK